MPVRATCVCVGVSCVPCIAPGGVVYFPRGQYFIRQPLVVDPGTVLRGAGAALSSIYFHEANVPIWVVLPAVV